MTAMKRTSRTLLTAVVAIIVAAAIASAAAAAAHGKAKLTGTWSGKTSQDIVITDPQTGDDVGNEWSVRITVTALEGRLAGVYTTVRTTCPGPAVGDLRIRKGWRSGQGPLLSANGGFFVRIDGVSIRGVLGRGGGSGRFDVSKGGCSGKGSWKARRVL
jgi:hypothetical protein